MTMLPHLMTLPEKLSREIERAIVLREVCYRARTLFRQKHPAGDVTPLQRAIAYLNATIETGHIAAGSGDALAMMEAVRKLEKCQR